MKKLGESIKSFMESQVSSGHENNFYLHELAASKEIPENDANKIFISLKELAKEDIIQLYEYIQPSCRLL